VWSTDPNRARWATHGPEILRIPLILLVAGLLLASAGCHGSSSPSGETSFSGVGALPALEAGTVALKAGGVLAPFAVGQGYVALVSGPLEAEDVTPRLVVMRIGSEAQTKIASDVLPNFGVATAVGRVIYAAGQEGAAPELVSVKLDGSGRAVLSKALIAPIASRAGLVAWAEQVGDRQRVVVRDVRQGRDWIAADLPRCEGGCFRIDAVTLADRGVVFTRGAIGPHPSFVLRRAFSAPTAERIEIANDPQPDLVPSSAGAVYYALERGWYRWDFGQAKPVPAPFPGPKAPTVLRFEDGTWFTIGQRGCKQQLIAQLADGTQKVIVSPDGLPPDAKVRADSCVQLSELVWTGTQPVSSWVVIPHESEEGHEDAGLVGVVVASARLQGLS
jgi:hypothetical protein